MSVVDVWEATQKVGGNLASMSQGEDYSRYQSFCFQTQPE